MASFPQALGGLALRVLRRDADDADEWGSYDENSAKASARSLAAASSVSRKLLGATSVERRAAVLQSMPSRIIVEPVVASHDPAVRTCSVLARVPLLTWSAARASQLRAKQMDVATDALRCALEAKDYARISEAVETVEALDFHPAQARA